MVLLLMTKFDSKALADEYVHMKLASPRWAREFLKLSPKNQAAILSTLTKERQIKALGHGGERIADLVAHPQHGLSVRKIPILSNPGKGYIEPTLKNREHQRQMEIALKEMTKGKGNFAHIKGRGKGERTYYEYVPGKDGGKDLMAKWEALRAKQKRLFNSPEVRAAKKKAKGVPKGDRAAMDKLWAEFEAAQAPAKAIDKELYAINDALMRPQRMDPATEKVITKLRKKFPGVHDIRSSNIIDGKIVDMSPGQVAIPSISNARNKNPVAFSKKRFLDTGGSRQGHNFATRKKRSKDELIAIDKAFWAGEGRRARAFRKIRHLQGKWSPKSKKPTTTPKPRDIPVTRHGSTKKDSGPAMDSSRFSAKDRVAIALGSAGIIGVGAYGVHKYISKKRDKKGKWRYKYRSK